MLNMLAQTTTDIIVGGVTGMSGAAVVALLVRRTIKKVLDHVENSNIHVNAKNGYVSKELCVERSEKLEEKIDEQRESIGTIHRRLDDAIKSQVDGTQKILAAIQNSADK